MTNEMWSLVISIIGIAIFLVSLIIVFSRREPVLPAAEEPAAEELAAEEPAAPPTEPQLPPAPQPPQRGWHERLVDGLRKTRGQLVSGLEEFFLTKDEKLSRDNLMECLFELLINADVGVKTTDILVERVRERISGGHMPTLEETKRILKEEIAAILEKAAAASNGATIEKPNPEVCHVVVVVGVNGVGKTTTVGKLAFKAAQRGQTVAIGAADTFRAAAVEQLRIWAERAQAAFVKAEEGKDPASVAFEAVRQAKEESRQICLIDTAGRLHNREDLMRELAKIYRVIGKEIPTAPHEVLLVVDATTGQNAIQQARVFRDVVAISGLVLTKLDGTAKGGVAVAIAQEFGLPIRYIGVGETVEDLEPFTPSEFVDALFE